MQTSSYIDVSEQSNISSLPVCLSVLSLLFLVYTEEGANFSGHLNRRDVYLMLSRRLCRVSSTLQLWPSRFETFTVISLASSSSTGIKWLLCKYTSFVRSRARSKGANRYPWNFVNKLWFVELDNGALEIIENWFNAGRIRSKRKFLFLEN